MTNHMDAAYVFQSMWAQGEQFQENQRQLKKLEAFLDQLMVRPDVRYLLWEYFGRGLYS